MGIGHLYTPLHLHETIFDISFERFTENGKHIMSASQEASSIQRLGYNSQGDLEGGEGFCTKKVTANKASAVSTSELP